MVALLLRILSVYVKVTVILMMNVFQASFATSVIAFKPSLGVSVEKATAAKPTIAFILQEELPPQNQFHK